MEKPTREEIHEAIAAFIEGNRGPYYAIAEELGISLSSIRRIAKKFKITRLKSIEQTVLDTLGPNWARELRDNDRQNEPDDK